MTTARTFVALIGIATAAVPLAAFAQPAGGGVNTPAPSYARPLANGEESVRGHISSIDGKYHLNVRDDRGFLDSIELHQGTIINPTGLVLRPGMEVTIIGYNRGRSFAAIEIDTPYQSHGVAPFASSPPVSIGFGFGPVYFNH
jgi:hypothetical protein